MTIGSHQQTIGKSQRHITPKCIIDALGKFDLDPCADITQPWPCAGNSFTIKDNGLKQPWRGRVWLNPPFHRYQVARWIARLAEHGRGTALLHARTETDWFLPCWQHATAMLFLADRIKFCKPNGREQPANSGDPVVLVAFGYRDARALETSKLGGVLVTEWAAIPEAAVNG